jgi:hypothetical protein
LRSNSRAIVGERLTAQALAGSPLGDPAAVAERLLAVQGQDPRGFRLAVRARTEGLSAADVERALSEERSLVVTWLNRGTLHLVRSEDYPWLQALTTPPLLTSSVRRLRQEGISEAEAERAVGAIERALAEEGPLTRIELRERVESAGVATEGQAMIHLLFLAALRGLVVRGPMRGKQHAYVLVCDWLGEGSRSTGRGPWPSWRAATSRAISRRATATSPSGQACRCATPAPLPAPRLLGAFDPVLLGWASREEILGPHTTLVTRNGIFHPFAMADGRAVAKWGMRGGNLTVEPLERLPVPVATGLESDAADVTRFLGA